ncbi:uncharacterized protein Z519_09595 [Cladophialophora bantiana CBS 173.52]|uniref:Glycosyltransferase 2-like domain-containing protein n=1 Tax=Cladophialophora bantiana (strain ATCC 10958 / CBS 173.52 / CDC B-1940 / NIH 8579) TaxID=1442370 RepID=A0A0D2HY15_CLAB1|nr:uncharacterized protein Z519_09595 [Cladophialophora bantiana CBS 173.52]KIW89439.1 hypothetical protein Z519_09595 [Cladophialophora bantiana CBS 173.52]
MRSVHLILMLRAYRFVKAILKYLAAVNLTPVPVSGHPIYTSSQDVSVIVPTIDPDPSTFQDALLTWYDNGPREIIIVTTHAYLSQVRDLVDDALKNVSGKSGKQSGEVVKAVAIPQVNIFSTMRASKRKQLAHGISQTSGRIVVLCDDDVFWPTSDVNHHGFLSRVLACFEDARVGGVGTLQRARPPTVDAQAHSTFEPEPSYGQATSPPNSVTCTIAEELAAWRLCQRNFSIAGTQFLDGSVTCLSGRTAAYRASVLKDEAFLRQFTHDLWRGKQPLDSGDDTFITRWLYSHGWRARIQMDSEARIETTVAKDWRKFGKQMLRWTRNSRRSYLRCLFGIPSIWR